jgi:hypothetical protein
MDDTSPTFTLFPALPSELRLKIWSFIALVPRTVTIEYKTSYDRDDRGKVHATSKGWISPSTIPVSLHICHDSRSVALKNYRLAFGSYFHEPEIYFNFSADTLSFQNVNEGNLQGKGEGPSDYLLNVFLGGRYHGANDTEKIQYLTIDINETLYGIKSFCWEEIRELTSLKELNLIAWEEEAAADGLMAHYQETLRTVTSTNPEWRIPTINVFFSTTGNDWHGARALTI